MSSDALSQTLQELRDRIEEDREAIAPDRRKEFEDAVAEAQRIAASSQSDASQRGEVSDRMKRVAETASRLVGVDEETRKEVGTRSGTRFRIGKGCAMTANGQNRPDPPDFALDRLGGGHRSDRSSPFLMPNPNASLSEALT